MAGAISRWRFGRHLAARPGAAIVVAIGLLAASLALAFHTETVARREHTRQLVVQSQILAGSVAAALAFDDRSTAQEYVDALRVNPEIDAAGVYALSGGRVAGFATGPAALPATNRLAAPREAGGEIEVTAPVVQNGMALGSVYLRAPIEPWTRRLSRYIGIGIILVMAALLVAGLGSSYAAATEANRRLKAEMEARRKAEEALRQSQKMEAMGQLTGGVAHDFNNLLMAASSGLELLDRTQDAARRTRLKQGIREALDRGAKLTQQLLTFARRSPVKPEVVDIGQRVASLRSLLERSLREDITISTALPGDLWPVKVDVSQFEVALLNIAINARDAMPQGGAIALDARNVPGEEGAEDRVELSVRDEGIGMPPELIDKVFEPFFTTKGVGHGTGLGLSQVYGFARAAGGTVQIDSVEGEGTTVTLVLPRSLEPLSAVEQPAGEPCSPDGRRCRVLLAEDDGQVAEMVGQMLQDLGYEMRRVADAAEALALIDRGFEADVLLSDMVMPGEMGGLDLARAARARRPGLPVLLMTGYSAAAADVAEENIALLAKPFRLDALGRALARLLDSEQN
ncbi:MAG: ATP-binding protein [Sphingomonas sp.]